MCVCACVCDSSPSLHPAPPRGLCRSLFVFVRGFSSSLFLFFQANTHFITLTLIKNTWPCSRGQWAHKSAQRSLQHSPVRPLARSLAPSLPLSPPPPPSPSPTHCWHPGLFNCGAALGSGTSTQRRLAAARPSVRALGHARLLAHTDAHAPRRACGVTLGRSCVRRWE